MEPIDQLIHQNDRMRDAATQACNASQDFARAANGNIIPAPTAYDLLGNIKVLLHNVQEITDHTPRGLAASLNDPRIEIYDRNDFTGEQREPAEQVAVVIEQLRALTAALAAAATHAEAAQSAINSQGYKTKGETS